MDYYHFDKSKAGRLRYFGVIITAATLAFIIMGGVTPAFATKKKYRSNLRDGISAYQDDKWKTVIKKLRPLIKKETTLPDYILFMVGTAEGHDGQCKKAASHFAELRQDYPKSIYATDAIIEEASALICDKKFEMGRQKAKEFLKTKPLMRRRQETLLLIAKSYLEEGDTKTAQKNLTEIWIDAKDSDLAEEAFALLKKAGGNPKAADKWRRARHLHTMREWIQAKNMLVELGAQNSYLFAECIFHLRDYPRAKKLFESLVKRGVSVNKSLGHLATINARTGNYKEAIKQNLSIAKRHRSSSNQKKALKNIASLHQDQKEFDKALDVLMELLQKPLTQKEKKEALEDFAWITYRSGDYDSAIATLDDLLKMKIKQEDAAKYLFWKGKFLLKKAEKENDKKLKKQLKEEAKIAFNDAWTEDKWDYYGLASLRALNEKDKKFFTAIKVEDQKRARKIRRVSVESSPPIDGLFHLPRAAALHELGFERLASKEMKAAYKESKNSPALMKMVGEIAYSVGNYYVPMVVALRKPGLLEDPESVWDWIYPKAYGTIVKRHAVRRKLDPLLIYSMMRQESAFQEHVISSAGARGLIQIMPFTGRRLARIMGWKGFKNSDLFEPEINIALSTLYVRMNSDLFEGHLPATIASYNAGEHAVVRWISSRKDLEDWEFIEEIPYRETNKYTKRVMRNYWMYQYLYTGQGSKAKKRTT